MARGVRMLNGKLASLRRKIIDSCSSLAISNGYDELFLPSIEPAEIYKDKAGPEILNQMYVFPDRKGRQLCLRPEGTATIQILAKEIWPKHKDVKLFYETRCWRYERPQAGRYREFTQFGVEWLWPRDIKKAREELIKLAENMVRNVVSQTQEIQINDSVKRGLAYYIEDGFEISLPSLGAQKQICGGGTYDEGVGFAIGIDRLMLTEDYNTYLFSGHDVDKS